MDDAQRVAYQQSQTAAALIEAMGMQAQNQMWTTQGQCPVYGETHFNELITKYGLGHNTVMNTLQGR